MASVLKSRRESVKLKPRELRLVWTIGIATAIVILFELYAGVTALTP